MGRESVKFLRQNTPMVWQLRLAYDRILMDEFQRMLDPEAYQAFSRQMAGRQKNYGGQKFWWEPGKPRPDRTPNLGAVFGRN